MIDLISRRLRYAREKRDFTQADLSRKLGFKDRQTLAAIEAGQRKLSAEELVRATQILGVDLEFFTDRFRLVDEGSFSWRTTKHATPALLTTFEEKAGRWIVLYRQLGERKNSVSPPVLQPRLPLTHQSSYEDACAAAENLGREWELGEVPALRLPQCVRDKLGALILNVDAPQSISGAACHVPGLNVILINRNEPEGRRHYDLAHEVFHLLTWEQMTPEHCEHEIPHGGKGKRSEQLADNFASALLMPERTLRPQWETHSHGDLHTWLNTTANNLRVTAVALKWRLVQLGWLTKADLLTIRDKKLTANGCSHTPSPTPRRFSEAFMQRLHDALATGALSVRRAASLLDMTIEDLGELFEDYELPIPFDL